MARRSAARILWVGLVAVVLILVLFPNTVTNLFQQQNVLGVDVEVQYANGKVEKFSSPTLSILNAKPQQIFDVKNNWAVNSYVITPWFIVSYTGAASGYSISGNVEMRLYMAGVYSAVDYGVKKTVQLTDTNTKPPASGEKRTLASITLTASEIESWASADGRYSIKVIVSPTVTLIDAAGQKVSKQGSGFEWIDINISRAPLLTITNVEIGLETKPMFAGGLA